MTEYPAGDVVVMVISPAGYPKTAFSTRRKRNKYKRFHSDMKWNPLYVFEFA